ncbi:MAG TPA: exonuclease [Streptosporangiaceae bacterium]|jgi:hypothetical protein|nr:exonuclease [Streptosporangiaceae bacterium]
MPAADVYFSVDVEADGPVPGPYSMISFGMCVAGVFTTNGFTPIKAFERTYYAELKPISDQFVPDALAVSGLDRDRLVAEGQDPAQAMTTAAEWVKETGAELGGQPVFAAYPLGFDWMWMYWYFVQYAIGGSPFGHSRAFDIKTLYAARANVPIGWSTKRQMPRHLMSRRSHTHNALDDAMEQAELFQNLLQWPGKPVQA